MTQTTPNSNPKSNPAEFLSALADGELGGHVTLNIQQHPSHNNLHNNLHDSLYADWNAYHTIGNVLRGPSAAGSSAYGADLAFLQRLTLRLKDEKIELPSPFIASGQVAQPHAASANDTNFRWKMVASLAAFGAVASIAWTFMASPALGTLPQLAQRDAGTELVVASPAGLMVRDARLEELLSAHKQLGSTSLQAPSGFLRNAGFETPPNDRR